MLLCDAFFGVLKVSVWLIKAVISSSAILYVHMATHSEVHSVCVAGADVM